MGSGVGVCRGSLPPGPYGPLLKQVVPKSKFGVLDLASLEAVVAEAAAETSPPRGVLAFLDTLWRAAARDTGEERPGPLEVFDLCSAALLNADAHHHTAIAEAVALSMVERLLKAAGSPSSGKRSARSKSPGRDGRVIVLCEALELWSKALKGLVAATPDSQPLRIKTLEAAEERLKETDMPEHAVLSLESAGWLSLLEDVQGDTRGLATVTRAAYFDGRLPLTVAKYAASVRGSTPFVNLVSVVLGSFGAAWCSHIAAELASRTDSLLVAKKPLKSCTQEEGAQLAESFLDGVFVATRKMAQEGKLGVLADIVCALQGTSVSVITPHHTKATKKKSAKKSKHGSSSEDDDDDADSGGSDVEATALLTGAPAPPRLPGGQACAWQLVRLAALAALALPSPSGGPQKPNMSLQQVLPMVLNAIAEGPRGEAKLSRGAKREDLTASILSQAASMRPAARNLLQEVGDVVSQVPLAQQLSSSAFLHRQVGRDAWGLQSLAEKLPNALRAGSPSSRRAKGIVGEDTSSDEEEAQRPKTATLGRSETSGTIQTSMSGARGMGQNPRMQAGRGADSDDDEDDEDEHVEGQGQDYSEDEGPAHRSGAPSVGAASSSARSRNQGLRESADMRAPAGNAQRSPREEMELALQQDLLHIFEACGGIPGSEPIEVADLIHACTTDAGIAGFFGLPAGIQEGDETWDAMLGMFEQIKTDVDGQLPWESLVEFFFMHIAPYVHFRPDSHEDSDDAETTPRRLGPASVAAEEEKSARDDIADASAAEEPPQSLQRLPHGALPSEAVSAGEILEHTADLTRQSFLHGPESTPLAAPAMPLVIEQPDVSHSAPSAAAGAAATDRSHLREHSAALHATSWESEQAITRAPSAPAVIGAGQLCGEVLSRGDATDLSAGWLSGRDPLLEIGRSGHHAPPSAIPSAEALHRSAMASSDDPSSEAVAAAAASAANLAVQPEVLESIGGSFFQAPAGSSKGPDPPQMAAPEVAVKVDQAVQYDEPAPVGGEVALQSQAAVKSSARAPPTRPVVEQLQPVQQPMYAPRNGVAGVPMAVQTSSRNPSEVPCASTAEAESQPEMDDLEGTCKVDLLPPTAAEDQVQKLQALVEALQDRTRLLESENSQLLLHISSIHHLDGQAGHAPDSMAPATSGFGFPVVEPAPCQQPYREQCAQESYMGQEPVPTAVPAVQHAAPAAAPCSQPPSLIGGGPLVNISFGGNGSPSSWLGGGGGGNSEHKQPRSYNQDRFDGGGFANGGMVNIRQAVQEVLAEERNQRLAVQSALVAAREWRQSQDGSSRGGYVPQMHSLMDQTPEAKSLVSGQQVSRGSQRGVSVQERQSSAPPDSTAISNVLAEEVREVTSELRGVGRSLANELRHACRTAVSDAQQSLRRQASMPMPPAFAAWPKPTPPANFGAPGYCNSNFYPCHGPRGGAGPIVGGFYPSAVPTPSFPSWSPPCASPSLPCNMHDLGFNAATQQRMDWSPAHELIAPCGTRTPLATKCLSKGVVGPPSRNALHMESTGSRMNLSSQPTTADLGMEALKSAVASATPSPPPTQTDIGGVRLLAAHKESLRPTKAQRQEVIQPRPAPSRKEQFERQLNDLDARLKGLDTRFQRLGSN